MLAILGVLGMAIVLGIGIAYGPELLLVVVVFLLPTYAVYRVINYIIAKLG